MRAAAPELRRYRPHDLPAVLRLWLAAMRNAAPGFSETFLTLELCRVRDVFLPQAETWVTVRDDRIIGFSALMGKQLGGLFVAPQHQRRGVGTALMRRAIAESGDLELDVFAANAPARTFYERFGFFRTESYTHAATGLTVLRMVRLR